MQKEKIDYVICPICNKKVKEINTAHLKIHNLNVKMFDELYPNYERLSKIIRSKKNTWEGKKHKQKTKEKIKESMKGKNRRLKSEDEKLNLSEKSKEMWNEKREQILFSRSIDGFILKYGKNEGTKKYLSIKTGPKSIIENKKEYSKYCEIVDKITRISIKQYKPKNIEKRSRLYHLDHRISKHYGFINNIDPYIIGSIYNLEIIECKINCSKQHYYNTLDVEELMKKFANDTFYQTLKEARNEIRTTRIL